MMKRAVLKVLRALLAGAFLAGVPAGAQTPYDNTSVNELTRLFSWFCLEKFPDREGVETLARKLEFKGMSFVEVKRYISDGQGQAFFLDSRNGVYVITLEDSPQEGCAVRRMTPQGISSADAYTEVLKHYAQTRKGTLLKAEINQQNMADGSRIRSFSNVMVDGGGRPSDLFMLIFTEYHGKVPEEWRKDAGQKGGVELRMEHRLIHP
jgi:hypothetical protein